jgi:hypothetical protein
LRSDFVPGDRVDDSERHAPFWDETPARAPRPYCVWRTQSLPDDLGSPEFLAEQVRGL